MNTLSPVETVTGAGQNDIRFRAASWLDRLRQVGILIALLLIAAVFSYLTPLFLSPSNLTNILVQSAITGPFISYCDIIQLKFAPFNLKDDNPGSIIILSKPIGMPQINPKIFFKVD